MAFLNELQAKGDKKRKPETNYSDCDVTYVYNALQTAPWSKHFLLLDIRSVELFNKSRIYNAINVDFDQIKDMETLKQLSDIPCSKANILKFIGNKKIIIYASNTNDTKESSEKINAFKQLLIKEENVTNCRILRDGFECFSNKYPFCVVNSNKRLPKYPHEIIPNKLYLGNGHQATNKMIVSTLNITHTANISKKIKCAFPEKIKYIDVQIDDLEAEDILSHIQKVVDFIDTALNTTDSNDIDDQKENNNKATNRVLVHCQYGISRSSSMVISYLMFKNKWTFEVAKKYVKDRRPQISPNDGFVKQLKEYEKSILSEN